MVTQIRRNKFFERIIEFNDLKKADPLINNFVNTKSKIVLLSLVFGFVLIQYLLSQVKFFLPDNPVPITLQTFGILMLGSLYGLRLTLASITVYLVLGVVGLPIFQGHNGGLDYFMGVTGGYLIGFFFASILGSFLSTRGLRSGLSIWAMLYANIVIYIPALIWLSIFDFSWPENGKLLSQAVYPFLIGDFVKLIFASLIISFLWKISKKTN
ncbi:MAG: biotin transporter BioY [Chloroflexota bacterium]|nr:biotin transporter BioY [Chloroflexota bacterium]MEC9451756.1 biotin transporter BioY [Chloroflexota bacterium]MQG04380.1 biotin transporter BioY [SAR202 cluster bacterium]|tara:strand:- start:7146 stop:7781 length:636 start_codon:yes stop_codon:yes gene_type:complete